MRRLIERLEESIQYPSIDKIKVGAKVEMERVPVYADNANDATHKVTTKVISRVRGEIDPSSRGVSVEFKGAKGLYFLRFNGKGQVSGVTKTVGAGKMNKWEVIDIT